MQLPLLNKRNRAQGGFSWAPSASYAWDFLANNTMYNSAHIGGSANTPNWSFTRATSGYAETTSGIYMPFSSGSMRITDKGLLLEGARTNLLLYCRDLTATDWVKSNTTAALTQIGVDRASASASLVTATAGLGTVLQTVTSASATRATTAFVKRAVGTGTIEFTHDGVSYTDITSAINTTTFTRFTLTGTVTNPVVGFRITTSGDAIVVDFAQLESAAAASSPILTTTASATRNADVLNITGFSGTYPLGLYAEVERSTDTGGTERWLTVSDGTTNNRAQLGVASTDVVGASTVTAAVSQGVVNLGSAIAIGAVTKAAMRTGTNTTQGAKNGTLGTEDTTVTVPASYSSVHIGCNAAGAEQCFGYIRRAAIWARALTDTELQQVTG